MPLYLLLFPADKAPSMVMPDMPLKEAVDRMLHDPSLAPLVYPGQEECYIQAALWPQLAQDCDLRGQPFATFSSSGELCPVC